MRFLQLNLLELFQEMSKSPSSRLRRGRKAELFTSIDLASTTSPQSTPRRRRCRLLAETPSTPPILPYVRSSALSSHNEDPIRTDSRCERQDCILNTSCDDLGKPNQTSASGTDEFLGLDERTKGICRNANEGDPELAADSSRKLPQSILALSYEKESRVNFSSVNPRTHRPRPNKPSKPHVSSAPCDLSLLEDISNSYSPANLVDVVKAFSSRRDRKVRKRSGILNVAIQKGMNFSSPRWWPAPAGYHVGAQSE